MRQGAARSLVFPASTGCHPEEVKDPERFLSLLLSCTERRPLGQWNRLLLQGILNRSRCRNLRVSQSKRQDSSSCVFLKIIMSFVF